MYNSKFSLKDQTTSVLRGGPRIIMIATLFAFLISNNNLFMRFAGYYLLAEFLSGGLKWVSAKISDNPAIYRPKGAGNCRGCGIVQDCSGDCINADNDIGMPSGHSLSAAMAATFWVIWIFRNGSGSTMSKIIRSIVIILAALAIIVSRTQFVENCHTIPQVTIGAMIGIGVGVAAYYFDYRVFAEHN